MEGPVSVTPIDHQEMIDLLNLCFREEGGDMLADYPRHVGLSNQENIRVIKEDGKIVSHIATSIRPVIMGGIPTSVAGIGAVATHPDARGKGYASILMEDAVKRSEQQGADIMLISNDLNLYRRHHARLCGTFPYIEINKGELQTQLELECRNVVDTDLDDIIHLREALSTRYLLPREDMAVLLQNKVVMDDQTEWWMILHKNIAAGFGAVECKGQSINLVDWSGHAEALQHAAAFWFNHYQTERFTFHAVNQSVLPIHWNQYIKDHVVFEGSVVVLNGIRLLERAQHYIKEKIGSNTWSALQFEGGKQQLSIHYEHETVAWDNGGDLAECFFGVPNRDMLAEKISTESELYAVLSTFLPLPLVWYGLGYV